MGEGWGGQREYVTFLGGILLVNEVLSILAIMTQKSWLAGPVGVDADLVHIDERNLVMLTPFFLTCRLGF